ncbi:MAG: hypothetical protein ABEL76_03480 [Bradymonadaceae bacterium]
MYRRLVQSLACVGAVGVVLVAAGPSFAQSDAASSDSTSASSETTEAKGNEKPTPDDTDEANAGGAKETSDHGTYEWKPSYGGGVAFGNFFNDFGRWNDHLLRPSEAKPLDVSGASSFTFALEASLLEGSRLTVFTTVETPIGSDPELLAVYGGLEPAFAFRRGDWEFALGMGVGLGSVKLTASPADKLRAGLVTLRPVTEVRYYASDLIAAFLRVGFNQWIPFDANTEGLAIEDPSDTGPGGTTTDEHALYTGGPFLSIGVRFGFYPEPVATIPDTDGDGRRDDVDDCVEKAEDRDGYRDRDGCADEDNDGDGVGDTEDSCPDEAEDADNWKDEDGCPDEAGDADGDGVADGEDDCARTAEDADDYEDQDGCPDDDNDGDGVGDADDGCPDQSGIEANSGCPSDKLTITGDRVELATPLQFESKEQTPALTASSQKTLDHLAETMTARSELGPLVIRLYRRETPAEETRTRADIVREYLVGAGVPKARLSTAIEQPGDDSDAPTPRIEFVLPEKDASSSDGASQ